MRRKPNNFYGQIIAPSGLKPVVDAVTRTFGVGRASTYHTRGSDAETLRIRTEIADLESIPLPGGMEYLLNGVVEGSIDDVIGFARTLSAALDEVRIEHTFDVHDGQRVVLSLPG